MGCIHSFCEQVVFWKKVFILVSPFSPPGRNNEEFPEELEGLFEKEKSQAVTLGVFSNIHTRFYEALDLERESYLNLKAAVEPKRIYNPR